MVFQKKSHDENCIFNDSSYLTALYMKRDCWSLYAILKVCEHWSRQNSTFSEAFPLAYLLTMSLNCLSEKKKHRSMLSWSGRSLEKQRKLIVSNSNNHVVQVPFLENCGNKQPMNGDGIKKRTFEVPRISGRVTY